MFANRALYRKGWIACCFHGAPWIVGLDPVIAKCDRRSEDKENLCDLLTTLLSALLCSFP